MLKKFDSQKESLIVKKFEVKLKKIFRDRRRKSDCRKLKCDQKEKSEIFSESPNVGKTPL